MMGVIYASIYIAHQRYRNQNANINVCKYSLFHSCIKRLSKQNINLIFDVGCNFIPGRIDWIINQIVTNDEFSFLDMKMSWSPEGDLQFGVFRNKEQQLKYVGKESTHTPSTFRAIPSGVLDRLEKLTSGKPSIQAEAGDMIYPAHANALCKAGLAPPVFPKIGELWGKQDEKVEKNNK